MEETQSTEREPNGREVVPCASCGSTAPADEQGLCPGVPGNKCRRTRVGGKLALKHDGRSKLTPEDLATRDALMNRLFRERGGRSALDIVSQLRVEDYATAQIQLGKVTKRLELLGAVSDGGKKRSSLVDTYNTFSARVERIAAELPPAIHAAGTSDLEPPPDNAEIIARLTDLLRSALALEHPQTHSTAGLPVTEPIGPAGEIEHRTVAPAPQPCAYCGQTPCIGRAHHAFEVLHYYDPEEQRRRDTEATKEMLNQIPRGLPSWYRE